jgi:hypothetical protein
MQVFIFMFPHLLDSSAYVNPLQSGMTRASSGFHTNPPKAGDSASSGASVAVQPCKGATGRPSEIGERKRGCSTHMRQGEPSGSSSPFLGEWTRKAEVIVSSMGPKWTDQPVLIRELPQGLTGQLLSRELNGTAHRGRLYC